VTCAANPAYPNLCYYAGGGCFAGPPDTGSVRDRGLLWLTRPDALSLATPANPVTAYVLNLRLRDPATAQAFADRYDLGDAASEVFPWTGIADADALLVQDEQQVLSPGAWLAALLAIASVAVLAGGRMTERTRRVGLLKAVGAAPGLVTATLMAENLVLALAAAAVGLVAGAVAASRAWRFAWHSAGRRAVRGRGSRRADHRAARLVAGGRGAGDAGRGRGACGRTGTRRRPPPDG
jgi:putative ABC transport system permease protein